VIWLHAVSVGETRAASRCCGRAIPPSGLRFVDYPDDCNGPGGGTAAIRGAVVVAWLPYDYPYRRPAVLRSFRPRLGILMETEIWFHLVGECQRSGVPLLLANARMSAKSGAATHGRAARPGRSRQLERGSLPQTTEDAERLRSLGARDVEVTGNLKFDADRAPE